MTTSALTPEEQQDIACARSYFRNCGGAAFIHSQLLSGIISRLSTARDAVRDEALEEAAVIADSAYRRPGRHTYYKSATIFASSFIASAIRALKTTPSGGEQS